MNRYMIAAGLVALASAIFAAVGLLEPFRFGWTAPAPFWVKAGLVVLLGLPIVWLVAYRHQLQSRWAISDESPVMMYAQVQVEEGSDSTAYYVCLRAAPDAPVSHRVAIQRPRGSIDAVGTSQAAQVFIDSRGKPLVVDVPGHRLWTMVT